MSSSFRAIEPVCSRSVDALVASQMDGPGALLAFELHGGHGAAVAVRQAVRLQAPSAWARLIP